MKMYNNIVITGANSPYFESLLTLINSIHKDSFELVDMIVVYDFGLDQTEINRLKSLKKIMIVVKISREQLIISRRFCITNNTKFLSYQKTPIFRLFERKKNNVMGNFFQKRAIITSGGNSSKINDEHFWNSSSDYD